MVLSKVHLKVSYAGKFAHTHLTIQHLKQFSTKACLWWWFQMHPGNVYGSSSSQQIRMYQCKSSIQNMLYYQNLPLVITPRFDTWLHNICFLKVPKELNLLVQTLQWVAFVAKMTRLCQNFSKFRIMLPCNMSTEIVVEWVLFVAIITNIIRHKRHIF